MTRHKEPRRRDINTLLADAKRRVDAMTPDERDEMFRQQAASFARAMAPCEHGVADWETCQACRKKYMEPSP